MNKVWLGLLALVVVVACSDAVGTMLEDAGTMLQDGGAHAQDATAHAVTCDQTRTVTRVDRDTEGVETFRIVQTMRFALVDTPNYLDVGIERCDPIGIDYGLWGCPPASGRTEYTCSGQVQKPCQFSWGAGNHIGNQVIIDCSQTSENTYAGRPELNSTSVWGYDRITAYY